MKNDGFAEIAAMGISNEGKGFIVPKPPRLKEKYLCADEVDARSVFMPEEKIADQESLYEEVERQKEYYRPFLEDLAPALESRRHRKQMTHFQWRIGTDGDFQDFAGVLDGNGDWEEVEVPHFGEPRGRAVTFYRTELELGKIAEDQSLWIVFKGVDYKAHVYLNGMYLGSHEGFFAPFEFDMTRQAHEGQNTLLIMVENDYIHMGSVSELGGEQFTGDKFYAATGPGYDEPNEGWHHCPPGMGIYQDVFVECRSKLFVEDIFVRPIAGQELAEVWLEIYDCQVEHRQIQVDLSVYGQNFQAVVVEHLLYEPATKLRVGMGDSLTEAARKAEGSLGKGIPMKMERGLNYLKVQIPMEGARRWELEEPWLYQVQVRLLNEEGHCMDAAKRQFGMRQFSMDENCEPKGKLYFNGRQIRLRGANTMGFEQQCVMKKDWEQLYTDLILAKVCRMNFLRLTQRPVQEEVYDYCDKIGLMLQTDLPAFGAIRRNQFTEGIKQAQEMEHLIRSHPCAVMVSYINEPMPNAKNMPHRCLERPELENFFLCADIAVRLTNPDRVIKHVDGDYDPPTEGFPDNHCYPCWYNGHGIDIGRLHKGYWMNVKPGWHYGCGEYGIEGMEEVGVMKKYYPSEWLPHSAEEEYEWTPSRLAGSQSGQFHYFFYDTQHTLEGWVRESQRYQAEAVKWMTEAYRRDGRMNSFAYHLFIDAFPDGWTKTIMDVDRNPKKGFFAYRDALAPMLMSLRTDRFKLFEGDKAEVECWICNDTVRVPERAAVRFQVYLEEELIDTGKTEADVEECSSTFQGFISFEVPKVSQRSLCRVQAALVEENGTVVNSSELVLEVFPKDKGSAGNVCLIGGFDRKIKSLGEDMKWNAVSLEEVKPEDCILAVSYTEYCGQEKAILKKVENGAVLLILELPKGNYEIAGHLVEVKDCGMLPLHFASRDTGHRIVEGMEADAVRYWYDPEAGYITPLLDTTFMAEGCSPILTSGNQDQDGHWQKTLAAGEFPYGEGWIRICQVKLPGRTGENPTANQLASRLIACR